MWLLPQWARLKTVYLDFLFSFEIPTLAGLEWAGECVCRPGNRLTWGTSCTLRKGV